jgi:hypothetical protein
MFQAITNALAYSITAQNCPSLKFRVKAKGAVYKKSTLICHILHKGIRLGQMFQTEINASAYNTKAQHCHSLIITAKVKGAVY